MIFVALLMGPLICMMKCLSVVPRVLADDVLIMAVGVDMLRTYSLALNQTHIYLRAIGGKGAAS